MTKALAVKTPSKVAKAKAAKDLEDTPRPFRNHYAGTMRVSACKTFEGAAEHAFSHVLRGHASNAQVVAPSGNDGFRFHWTSYGVSVWVGPDYKRPSFTKDGGPKLRRVK